MTSWKILMFHRKYSFKWWVLQPVMLIFRGVHPWKFTWNPKKIWCGSDDFPFQTGALLFRWDSRIQTLPREEMQERCLYSLDSSFFFVFFLFRNWPQKKNISTTEHSYYCICPHEQKKSWSFFKWNTPHTLRCINKPADWHDFAWFCPWNV